MFFNPLPQPPPTPNALRKCLLDFLAYYSLPPSLYISVLQGMKGPFVSFFGPRIYYFLALWFSPSPPPPPPPTPIARHKGLLDFFAYYSLPLSLNKSLLGIYYFLALVYIISWHYCSPPLHHHHHHHHPPIPIARHKGHLDFLAYYSLPPKLYLRVLPGMEGRTWHHDMDVLRMRTGRQIRFSPLYPRMESHGAVFGQNMGYERPLYLTRVPDTGGSSRGGGSLDDDDDDGNSSWYYDRGHTINLSRRGDEACVERSPRPDFLPCVHRSFVRSLVRSCVCSFVR